MVTKYYIVSVIYTLGIVKATQKTGPSFFFFQFIDKKKNEVQDSSFAKDISATCDGNGINSACLTVWR